MNEIIPFGGRPFMYRLDENNIPRPISINGALELQEAIRQDSRARVGETYVLDANDVKMRVSTVFLAVDHGHIDTQPILFETMIFGGMLDGSQWRYLTYEDAKKGHENIVQAIVDEYGKPALTDTNFIEQGADHEDTD